MNLSRRDAIKLAMAGALSPLLSLLPEREAVAPLKDGEIRAVKYNPDFGEPVQRMRVTQEFHRGQLTFWKGDTIEMYPNGTVIIKRAAPRTEGGR